MSYEITTTEPFSSMKRKALFSKAGQKNSKAMIFHSLFLIVFTFSSIIANAQSMANYAGANFSATSGTFTALSGGTTVPGLLADDVASGPLPIGFTFYYMGKAYTQFRAGSDGYLSLYTSGTGTSISNNLATGTTVERPVIAPYWDDMDGRGTGAVASYLTTGTVGSRVLTFEWLNWGRTGVTTPQLSFQAKLYESTGIIQFIYRQESAALGGTVTASIGLSAVATGSGNYVSLNNASASPTTSTTSETTSINAKPATGQVYTFTPPQAAVATPSAGVTFTGTSASSMTLNWTDGSTNETGYNIFRSIDNVNFTWVATVNSTTVAGTGTGYTSTQSGLSVNTLYYWKVFANSEGVPSAEVNGNNSTLAAQTYTWNVVSGAWGTPASWSPDRNTPDATDILQFNNIGVGTTQTATGVPVQSISRLIVGNGVNAILQAGGTNSLTIVSDGTAADELSVASGSSLLVNGTSALTTTFTTGSTASIAGTFELNNTTGVNALNLTNCIMTVTSTGKLAAGGTVTTSAWTGVTSTTLQMSGTYEHKYTTAAGTIPTASWLTGSTALISGYTSNTTSPSGVAQSYVNFTWNCTSQTGNLSFGGTVPSAVTGTFTVASTGSGSLRLAAGTSPTLTVNNFSQTGGTIELNSGAGSTNFQVSGTFNQSAGIIQSSANGAGTPIIHFNGTSGIQSVNFFNLAPQGGGTVYRISNPNGINLTGSGTLTSAFNINTTGGVRVSTTASAPITTSLTLTYAATGSTLTYDVSGNVTATATEFPAANGPSVLVVNVGGANTLTLPFSRSLSPAGANGGLTMTSGNISLGANSLTLGTSPAFPGTLTYSAGLISITSGSLTRWFPTAGLPTTTGGTGIGFYPIASSGNNRAVNVYFSAATALTTGGTITISHNDASGVTSQNFLDGAYQVDKRINAGWTISQSGLVASGTISLRLAAAAVSALGSVSLSNTNLRLIQDGGVVGTHVNSSYSAPSFRVDRTGLTVAQIANTHYIGASNADIPTLYTAIASTDWSLGTTWDQGSAPGSSDAALIPNGFNVTTDAGNVAGTLTIASGGTLTSNAGSLTVSANVTNNGTIALGGGTVSITGTLANAGTATLSAGTLNVTAASTTGITNSGTFTLSGATVNLGPAGGSNRTFAGTAGTISVSSGVLNVYGNLSSANGAVFNQSGGNINVDGNAAGVAGNSVASGTSIVSLNPTLLTDLNLTGGTFTIVDPHANATLSNAFASNTPATGTIIASGSHTFRLGDGVSTDAGGNAAGFKIEPWLGTGGIRFNNVELNGPTGTNRIVTLTSSFCPLFAGGNLTLNNGASLIQTNTAATGAIAIGGNITVNTGATLTTLGLFLVGNGNYVTSTTVSTSPTTVAQTISNSGTIRNLAASPTANFTSVQLNNSNVSGVTLNGIDISLSGTLTFTLGKLNTGANKVVLIAGAVTSGAAQATGYVVGNLQRNFATGTNVSRVFDVGTNNYAPATINFASVSTAGNLVVTTAGGDHPNLSTSGLRNDRSVNRFWTATNAGIVFTTYALTLGWQTGDNDVLTAANLKVGKYDAPNWTLPVVSGTPTATSIVTTNSITSFSDFAVAENCPVANAGTISGASPLCIGATSVYSSDGDAGGTWSSSDNLVATVDPGTGEVTAIAVGSANIIYTVTRPGGCSSVTAFKSVTVSSNAAITSVTGTSPLCIGETTTYTANGVVLSGGSGSWSSDNTLVATVDPGTGLVTAIGAGSANISFTITGGCGGTVSASQSVTVNPNVNTGTVSGTSPLCIGATTTYTSNGDAGGTWSSDDALVATVDPGTGLVTAIGAGTTNINYTINSGCGSPASASQSVTVNPNVNAGTVSGTSPLCIGATTTYTSNGDAGGTWSSDDALVATVDPGTGLVTAIGAGTTNINYTINSGCGSPAIASQSVTVNPNVNPGTVSGTSPLAISQTTTYTTNGDAGGTWSSSNPAVASVDPGTGFVTALSGGSTNITYTINSGCGAPASSFQILNVSAGANPGTISGTSPLCIGGTATYTSNGDAGGTWSSTNPLVASVDPGTGLVTALSAGTTDITYTVAGPSSSFKTLTVVSGAAPTVSGPTNVCPFLGNNVQVSYTASAIGATSYLWTLPPNVNLISGAGTATITVTFNAAFGTQVNKQLRVRAVSVCGTSAITVYSLLVQYPSTPAPIVASTNNVCPSLGTNVPITFTIPKVTAATQYIWTAQAGTTTINHPNGLGENDTTITVTFTSGFSSSAITVQAVNDCGTSGTRSITLTRSNPSMPSPIAGPTNVCEFIAPNGTAATYSVPLQPNVETYTWNLPVGAINVTGQGTNSVSFIFPVGYSGGSISVSASNGCGSSATARTLALTRLNPATPSVIDVIQTASCPNREYTYTLASMPANATSILWVASAGTIISGQGSISITVSYPSTAVNGTVTATAFNNCGNSVTRSVDVKLPACPIDEFSKGSVQTSQLPVDALSVQVFPNPTVSDFKLMVKASAKEQITVRVLDLQGRELNRMIIMPDALKSFGSNLRAGTYMIEVLQGKKRTVQKLIKL